MKYYLTILTTLLICGCNRQSEKTLNNEFLSTELQILQENFYAKLKSDYPRYKPTGDRIYYLDQPFEFLVTKIDSIENKDTLLSRINKCKEVLINISGPLEKTRERCIKEMNLIAENIEVANKSEIKQHLQTIRFIYWSAYEKIDLNYLFTVDKIGFFQSDTIGKLGKDFTTIIVPVAIHTTFNDEIITGDSLSKETGKLLGKLDTLELNSQHYSIFKTKNKKKGKYKIPSQLLTRYTDGRHEIINFNIEYKIE